MTDAQGSTSKDADLHSLHKEWDQVFCPICMDHPHNAVLLLCSSHDNGCRSYICDTSYRHSNCLDRFKKLKSSDHEYGPPQTNTSLETLEGESLAQRSFNALPSLPVVWGLSNESSSSGARESFSFQVNNGDAVRAAIQEGTNSIELGAQFDVQSRETLSSSGEMERECFFEPNSSLKCPLCRGTVKGCKIVKEAREYLDLKQRSCSRESCSFSGNYQELRRHARRVHPTTRPADVDPSRQRAWRHLEHRREYGDIMSAIRSAMPGAIVYGDYVIDNGDLAPDERETGHTEGAGSLWTTVLMFHMMRSADEQRRGISRVWRRHRRSSSGFSSRRRYLWGENLLGLRGEDNSDDWNLPGEMGDDVPIPRRRRRFTRSRHDEDQP